MKAIWHENQILVVSFWSVMIFIGYNVIIIPLAFSISSEEEEHCEDNGGDWSKEERSCKFDNEDDEKEYAEKNTNTLLTNQRYKINYRSYWL
jgi:hypothetical protein